MSRVLQPVPVSADDTVLGLLPMLREALSGAGPAVLAHAAGTVPAPSLRAGEPLDGGQDDESDPTVAVVPTSGSTGSPKGVLLHASALLASASATHDRLGGAGRWLLALPVQHVAGLQVLVRSLVAGAAPVVLDLTDGFRPDAFAAAAAALPTGRRYTALVPTQLVRLLDAGGPGLAALASFDAVLVGGAATPRDVLDRCTAAGVRAVTTYGMSETCGGCVYDGVPLDGVGVVVEGEDERVVLSGPVVARGYRGTEGTDGAGGVAGPGFRTGPDGVRSFGTDDAGRLVDGRLEVLGRLDDVVVTGGLKVAPAAVEGALRTLPEVAEAVVVAAPDAQWGQRVVAAVVLVPGAAAPSLARVRARVAEQVAAHAGPRQLLVLDRMPLRGPGKPDRTALTRLATLGDRG